MLSSVPKSFFAFAFLLLAFTQVGICNGAALGHSSIAPVGDTAATTHGLRSFDNMSPAGGLDRREPKGLKFVENLLTTLLRRHHSSTKEGALDKREKAVDFDRREPLGFKLATKLLSSFFSRQLSLSDEASLEQREWDIDFD